MVVAREATFLRVLRRGTLIAHLYKKANQIGTYTVVRAKLLTNFD